MADRSRVSGELIWPVGTAGGWELGRIWGLARLPRKLRLRESSSSEADPARVHAQQSRKITSKDNGRGIEQGMIKKPQQSDGLFFARTWVFPVIKVDIFAVCVHIKLIVNEIPH